MSDRALMPREEARFLKAAQSVLLQGGFPNPERTGCPDKPILKAIASREVSPGKVMDWIEHVGMCSPCFREYTELRRQVVWRRRAAYLSIAAAVIFSLFLGWWRWRSGQQAVITAHNHIDADIRSPLVLRGDQGPGKGPLVFQRGFDDVTFYFPEGSRAGTYEVAILGQEFGEPLARASGTATIESRMTTMNVTLDLSRIAPGYYLVGIRPLGTDWSYYPVIVK